MTKYENVHNLTIEKIFIYDDYGNTIKTFKKLKSFNNYLSKDNNLDNKIVIFWTKETEPLTLEEFTEKESDITKFFKTTKR